MRSCSEPSSSTRRAAPRPTGYPAFAICSVATIVTASIISIAPGTAPAWTISETASPACRMLSKKATSVRVDSGTGTTRSQTMVAMPRGAVGADERAEQVVAGLVELRPTEMDHLTIGQDDFQPGDVVRGEPVLEAVRATRVLGDVAADRAHDLARRVGRVEEVRRHSHRDRHVGDPRLDAHPPVVEVDVEHPGEPRQHKHAVGHRQRTAGQAGSAPRGTHGTPAAAHAATTSRTCAQSPGRTATAGSVRYWRRPSLSYVRSWCLWVNTHSAPTMSRSSPIRGSIVASHTRDAR